MSTLVLVDLAGIQRYVARSNRLRDVVGGSELVRQATDELLHAATDGLGADELFAAAGAAALTFHTPGEASEFAGRYTRRLLEAAPGVEATVVAHDYQPGELAAALLVGSARLARAKLDRRPAGGLLGLGVTAPCRETGLPASGVAAAEVTRPLSRLVLRRRAVVEQANVRWHDELLGSGSADTFPLELDALAATEEDRHLGVVRVDGNNVGERLTAWLTACVQAGTPDDEVAGELRRWSRSLTDLCTGLMDAVVARVTGAVTTATVDGQQQRRVAGTPEALTFGLRDTDDGGALLPVRPIVAAGDDLTVVCDGRIAHDLADQALRALDDHPVHKLGGDQAGEQATEQLTAAAGVAVVPLHSPFARAYALAGELVASAKRAARDHREQTSQEVSAIDWHVGLPPLGRAGLAAHRRRLDTATCRPYLLAGADVPGSWEWLREVLLAGTDPGLAGPAWSQARSKRHRLAELARHDPAAVAGALAAWQLARTDLDLADGMDRGFVDGRSPLADAVELLDRALTIQPAPSPTTPAGAR